jgi:hypothetical protein
VSPGPQAGIPTGALNRNQRLTGAEWRIARSCSAALRIWHGVPKPCVHNDLSRPVVIAHMSASLAFCALQCKSDGVAARLARCRSPPWAFPPLTWAASFLAALFSSPARLFMLVYGRDFSR